MDYGAKKVKQAILQFRLGRAQQRALALHKVENRFPWIRLGVVAVLLVSIYLGFQLLPIPVAWLIVLLSLAIFVIVARMHQRVIDQVSHLEAFSRLLTAHIARLALDWPNIPPPTPISMPAAHPFNADLDITGEKSLHQLLDTSASLGGSRRLADWLLAVSPDPARIEHRQGLVSELLARGSFRTRLELNGMEASPEGKADRWDGSALLIWLERHSRAASLRPRLVLLSALALADIVLFGLYAARVLPPYWIATLLVYLGMQALQFRETSETFDEAYSLSRQLGQLRVLLTDLETYPYPKGEQLTALCAPFWKGPKRPSSALRQVGLIVTASSLRQNPFLNLVLNILTPWDLFFAYQLERYKGQLSGVLPAWLDTWYELESLSALATFAALNPENTFPRLLGEGSQPVLAGRAIGHPLIPDPARVTNDFTIQQLGEITIITGSNMSGKSTFLRTVGVNLVLAYSGSTVACRSLEVLPFRLYTSMNVNDSLSDGISFFYAEVRRLKALLDRLAAVDPFPLFFFIDEIFRGTNNRERRIGSHAYTRALAGRHGSGLISTHDLELASLADSIPLVQNRHFREEIRDGQMVFDFKIRAGASPTTNALKIMAIAGLPVPPETTTS